jgi:phosphate-selective porin
MGVCASGENMIRWEKAGDHLATYRQQTMKQIKPSKRSIIQIEFDLFVKVGYSIAVEFDDAKHVNLW